jgi:hypothetical protein
VAKRHAPALAGRLRARLQPPLRADTLDGDDPGLAVDVASLERDPLLGAKAGAGGEDWDRREAGIELSRDRVDP